MASSTDTRREPGKGAKASPLEGTKLAPARRVPTWVAWVVGLILLALVCYMALFMGAATPVSYTHLTLPTSDLV